MSKNKQREDAKKETIRKGLLDAVEHQLTNGDPPEARDTYNRLIGLNCSDEEARSLIASALIWELNTVAKSGKEYDQKRYVACLHNLPDLPGD